MKRAKIFLGGLVAAISLSAGSALARPAYNPYNPYYPPAEEPRPQARFDEALEYRVIELVNSVRARYGLSDLRLDARGTRAARDLANQAGRDGGFFAGQESVSTRLYEQGIDTQDREFGEVRSVVNEDDVETMALKIVKKWFKNQRQSRFLLSEELTYVGVGAYVDRDGEVSVVLDAFGAKRVVTPPPAPPQYGGCNNGR